MDRRSRSRSRERELSRHESSRHRDNSRDRYRSSDRGADRARERHREDRSRRNKDRSRSRERERRPRSKDRDRGNRSRDRNGHRLDLSSVTGRDGKSDGKETLDGESESTAIDLTQDEQGIMSVMGFVGFNSTKGKKVKGNNIYVANISKKRKYRQYMNRRGGFNRPLDSTQ